MRSSLQSGFREKQRKLFLIRVGVFILGFILFVISLALLSGMPYLTIQKVSVEGGKAVDPAVVTAFVEDRLAGRTWHLFSRSNILLYKKGALVVAIREAFPRFETVAADMRSGKELVIEVTERKPEGLWCEFPGEASCYFLDARGFIFDKAPHYSGAVLLRFEGGIASDPIGQTFLSGGDFEEATAFLKKLPEFGFEPARFTLLPDKTVRVVTAAGEEIRGTFDPAGYEDTLLKLRLALPEVRAAQKKTGKALAYIDLRFGSQVVYKLR